MQAFRDACAQAVERYYDTIEERRRTRKRTPDAASETARHLRALGVEVDTPVSQAVLKLRLDHAVLARRLDDAFVQYRWQLHRHPEVYHAYFRGGHDPQPNMLSDFTLQCFDQITFRSLTTNPLAQRTRVMPSWFLENVRRGLLHPPTDAEERDDVGDLDRATIEAELHALEQLLDDAHLAYATSLKAYERERDALHAMVLAVDAPRRIETLQALRVPVEDDAPTRRAYDDRLRRLAADELQTLRERYLHDRVRTIQELQAELPQVVHARAAIEQQGSVRRNDWKTERCEFVKQRYRKQASERLCGVLKDIRDALPPHEALQELREWLDGDIRNLEQPQPLAVHDLDDQRERYAEQLDRLDFHQELLTRLSTADKPLKELDEKVAVELLHREWKHGRVFFEQRRELVRDVDLTSIPVDGQSTLQQFVGDGYVHYLQDTLQPALDKLRSALRAPRFVAPELTHAQQRLLRQLRLDWDTAVQRAATIDPRVAVPPPTHAPDASSVAGCCHPTPSKPPRRADRSVRQRVV